MRSLRGYALGALCALASAGCASGGFGKSAERHSRAKTQETLRQVESVGLMLGEFPLARDGVVDGDTIRVKGLETSLRLLAIDTEEKFRTREQRQEYSKGWDRYVKSHRGSSVKPVKMATPMGEIATDFAKDFFDGVDVVRVERDDPTDIRGRYGRYLAYVFAEKDGKWLNYNVEAVRAGMTPYFMKYGYSRRFHPEFMAAMDEARSAGRGIWDPELEHYPDYEERLRWWTVRGDFIEAFEKRAEGMSSHIALSSWDALRKLEAHEGKEVAILATVGAVRLGDKGPTKVMLSRRRGADFPLIFFDKDVFGSSRIQDYRGEFVVVTGTVTRYHNRHLNKDELQILVHLPGQISGPTLPWHVKESK